MSSLKFTVLAALFAAFALFAVGSGASAAAPAKTKVKLTNHSDVAGQLKSSRDKCVDERNVKLMEKQDGNDNKVGMDTSDEDGSFSFGNPGLDKGDYYVKAPSINGCKAGKSKSFEVT